MVAAAAAAAAAAEEEEEKEEEEEEEELDHTKQRLMKQRLERIKKMAKNVKRKTLLL